MIKRFQLDFSDKLFPGHLEHLKDFKVKGMYISGDDLIMYLRSLTANPDVVYGIDIETYTLPEYEGTYGAGLMAIKSQIRTIQIYDGKEVVVMDFMGFEGKHLWAESKSSIGHICRFLTEGRFVAHNAQFEVNHFNKLLEVNGTPAELEVHCTMNAYRLIRQATTYQWADYSASLKDVSKVVLGVNVDKDIQHDRWKTPGPLDDEQIQYCARDCVLPMLLLCELWANLRDFEMLDFYKLQTRLYNVLAHMHLFGAPIDEEAHNRLIEEWKKKLEAAEVECFRLLNADKGFEDAEACWQVVQDKIAKKQLKAVAEDMIGCMHGSDYSDPLKISYLHNNFAVIAQLKEHDKGLSTAFKRAAKNLEEHLVNPGSDKQLSNWVKKHVDKDILNEWPITEASQNYVDECVEKNVKIDPAKIQLKMSGEAFDEVGELEIIKPIQEYKKYSKLISTYGEGLQKFYVRAPWRDGPTVHAQYSTCFTETGRLSTSKPTVQNAPRDKEFRKVYSTRGRGYTFLSADFSQIELRVQAELTQDPVMLQIYRDGLDIHDITAENILKANGQTRDTVSEETWKTTRTGGKITTFTAQYGGGGNAASKGGRKAGVRLPVDVWKGFVDAYRQTYHVAYQWQLDQAAHCKETLKCRIPGGKLAALHPDYAFTQSINFPIQGAAAVVEQITLCELYKIYCLRRDLDFRITKTVHDDRHLDVRDNDVETVGDIVVRCMLHAWKQVFPGAIMNGVAAYKTGKNWGECGD